ncbi:hypothetical protein K402DRAFT_191994 [Aulographum hederae CBS 113979]|uniref:Uncharacterized protein n=1 Tax=Aulographum hederae CBS 113979 TaxID=1176131 RepID=A0A6G1GPK3_9PEZI|nr:hypothetical protein K402DRAFT_191994 [Aulographum hederae CBS 113979]
MRVKVSIMYSLSISLFVDVEDDAMVRYKRGVEERRLSSLFLSLSLNLLLLCCLDKLYFELRQSIKHSQQGQFLLLLLLLYFTLPLFDPFNCSTISPTPPNHHSNRNEQQNGRSERLSASCQTLHKAPLTTCTICLVLFTPASTASSSKLVPLVLDILGAHHPTSAARNAPTAPAAASSIIRVRNAVKLRRGRRRRSSFLHTTPSTLLQTLLLFLGCRCAGKGRGLIGGFVGDGPGERGEGDV